MVIAAVEPKLLCGLTPFLKARKSGLLLLILLIVSITVVIITDKIRCLKMIFLQEWALPMPKKEGRVGRNRAYQLPTVMQNATSVRKGAGLLVSLALRHEAQERLLGSPGKAWNSPRETLSPPVALSMESLWMKCLRVELPEKNISCSIKYEFQINNKWIFGYVSNIARDIFKLKNYSLHFWNSNLSGHPVFLSANSKETGMHWTLSNFLYTHMFSKIIGRWYTRVFTCRLCSLMIPSLNFNLSAPYLGQIVDAQVADKETEA